MNTKKSGIVALSIAAILMLVISGCAEPTVRTNYDKSADFKAYKTFGWVKELGTNRAGYTTLITETFKDAVGGELKQRGYTYAESDPDLLVNFYTNLHNETAVQTVPATVGAGYYGYRYGLYTAPAFNDAVYVDSYQVGTANVDLVDAKRKQLIWSGLVQAVLTDEMMQNPDKAIHQAVKMMFAKFPATAGEPIMTDSTK